MLDRGNLVLLVFRETENQCTQHLLRLKVEKLFFLPVNEFLNKRWSIYSLSLETTASKCSSKQRHDLSDAWGKVAVFCSVGGAFP